MSKEIISQLKKIKEYNGQLNADRVWVAAEREQILRQINNTVRAEKSRFNLTQVWAGMSVFLPNRFVYNVVRPVAVFVLVGAVATSGWIASVSATQNCLPGETCYGVKLATEKTQELVVAVSGSNQAATQMHLEFAKRRAEEVKKVAINKAPDAPEQAEVAIKKLEKSMQSAQATLKNVGESEPEKMIEATKDMAAKTEEIKTNLQEAQKQNTEVNVAEAKKIVADVKVGAIVDVIEKQAEGKLPGATEEVKSLVTNHINNLLADSKEVQTKVVKVVKDIVPMPTSTTENTITSTLPVILTTSTVSTEVKTAVVEVSKTVTETGRTVEKSLGEAQTLVNNNQLKEAMEKVKEATNVTQQTEQAVTETAKAVKEVSASNTTTSLSNVVLPPVQAVPTGTSTLEKK